MISRRGRDVEWIRMTCWTSAPKIVPRTTAEMQNPEFWISQISNPDKVIMTPEQIVKLNEKNKTREKNK